MNRLREKIEEIRRRLMGRDIDHAALSLGYTNFLLKWMSDDPEVKDKVKYLLLQATNAEIKNWHKALHPVKRIKEGKARKGATTFSQWVHDSQTGEVSGRRHRSYWAMSFAQVVDFVESVRRRFNEASLQLEVAERLLACYAADPIAATLQDAWLAAGHSIEEIDLDLDAA